MKSPCVPRLYIRTPFATLVLNLNLIDSRDAEMGSLIKSHRTSAEPLKYRLSATGKEQKDLNTFHVEIQTN
jgi:hypothetical protein